MLVLVYTGPKYYTVFSYLEGDAPVGLSSYWFHKSKGRLLLEGDVQDCVGIHRSHVSNLLIFAPVGLGKHQSQISAPICLNFSYLEDNAQILLRICCSHVS